MNCASSYGTSDPAAHGEEDSCQSVWRIAGFLSLAMLAEGYDIGVINGAIICIQLEFGLSSFEVAVLVSLVPLFVMIGAPLGGWIADYAGRRVGLSIVALFLLLGPLMMAVARSFVVLVCGRVFIGLGIGAGFVVASTYISEVAPAKMKGKLVGVMELTMDLGILLAYFANWAVLGVKNDWRIMLVLGTLLTCALGISLLCGLVPESPRWLFLHQNCNEASTILTRFADKNEATEVALSWSQGPQRDMRTWGSLLFPWHDTRLLRQLSAGLAVGVAQVSCGLIIFNYFSSKAMMQVTDEATAFLNTIIMGVIKQVVGIGAVFSLDFCSLRMLFLASATVTSAASLWIAMATSLSLRPWMVCAGFWLGGAGLGLSLGPITKVYLMEVFPTETRSKGTAAVYFVSRSLAFASTFVFPIAIDDLGVTKAFTCLAASGAVGVVLLAVLVEDVKRTNELTLSDQQNPFVRKTS